MEFSVQTGIVRVVAEHQPEISVARSRECVIRIAHGKLIHVFKLLSLLSLQRTANHLAAMVNTPGQFDIDMECRPYELGWLLLAFARR